MKISVIICSHNPDSDKFNRVLDSLKSQNKPFTAWELIVVDNCSTNAIENAFDFSWHPDVTHVIEAQLGVSVARARGIREAHGDLLVMVDDDSPLFPDYITQAEKIALEYPYIGCFGGNQLPLNESLYVASRHKPYLEMIGFRTVREKRISNIYRWDTTPAGAGLVIRAVLAEKYATAVFHSRLHATLGRRGETLMSSQDIDLAYNAIDQGFFTGVFPELKVYHLSIEEHLNDEYLIQRFYYNVYSSNLLTYIRFGRSPKKPHWLQYLTIQFVHLLRGRKFEYKMNRMNYRARKTLKKAISDGTIQR